MDVGGCVCFASVVLVAKSPFLFARSALQPPGGNQVDGLPPVRHTGVSINRVILGQRFSVHQVCSL